VGYAVKEIFYTLQGEGALTGRPAVFCRFAGCNLWSGREADRAEAACNFCDTDFIGIDGTKGGRYPDAAALADRIAALWPEGQGTRFVVCTGGEPLLQLDPPLVAALHQRGFESDRDQRHDHAAGGPRLDLRQPESRRRTRRHGRR
jgi:organic radical activating enzyme